MSTNTHTIVLLTLILTLLFAGSTPVSPSPFIMGDANPNHEMLGPWPCPQISPGVCATPQQIADEPDGTDQP